MQIPLANTFILGVVGVAVVVALLVLRDLGRKGVYWVFSWFALAPSSAILIGGAWIWARTAEPAFVRTLFGTLFVLALARGLFFVKVHHLRTYACMEILFATGMAAKTMHDMKAEIPPVDMLTIGTSAYLVIRGMDNYKKDLDTRKVSTQAQPVATVGVGMAG